MKQSPIAAADTAEFTPGAIQKFELRYHNHWVVYHVIPYQGFIVEKTEPSGEAFPAIVRIKYSAESAAEWLEYYEKLLSFQAKNKNVIVTTSRRIKPLSIFNTVNFKK